VTERTLARVQAASGLAFAFFLALHLATTASALAGPAAYDGVLAALRRVYRPTLAVELALIALPAVLHVACAVRRLATRRGPAPTRLRLHHAAGYVLLAAIGGHVLATRVMPAFGSAPADFSYLAYSLLNWPAFMWPYYVTLGAAGAFHLLVGTAVAARVLVGVRASPRLTVTAASVAAALIAAAAVSMIIHAPDSSRTRFPEFRTLYERFLPFLPPRL
jgi:succinate dehydrogenase/fumarate reductase cytochrome b subunit